MEVITGEGCKQTGDVVEVGTAGSVEGRGWEQIGEVGVLKGRPSGGSGGDFMGEVGITGSCAATGWKHTGERGV